MIETSNCSLIATCDLCGDQSEGFQSFNELMEHLKSSGWKIVKTEPFGDYEHYCEACREWDD